MTAADDSLQTIYLGPPIASVGLADAMRPDCVNNLRDVLRAWILIDRENIANRHAGMYWVTTPSRYRTNELPRADLPSDVRMYWNAKNLGLCERNFSRAATGFRLTIEAASPKNKIERRDMVAPLDAALKAFAHAVDPGAAQALKKHCGISLPPAARARSR